MCYDVKMTYILRSHLKKSEELSFSKTIHTDVGVRIESYSISSNQKFYETVFGKCKHYTSILRVLFSIFWTRDDRFSIII